MSRILVLGLDNRSIGEFNSTCTLGYTLYGNPAVSPGGNSGISIPDDIFAEPWTTGIDFGRMVIVQPEDLPTYAGMLETNWDATVPVTITAYDAEILFNIRASEAPDKLRGSIDQIVSQLIDLTNSLGDLNLRLGNVYEIDRTVLELPIDNRSYWEQLQSVAIRTGTEFIVRPEKGDDKSWYFYLDLAKRIGADTEFLLSDGDNGNMKVNSAVVRGEIINRKVGINSASGKESRLYTEPLINDGSSQQYRVRNRVVQFRDVTDKNVLRANTQASLDASSYPYLELSVDVTNVDHAFLQLRPGNRLMTHVSKIRLPRGIRGWRGMTRITKMVFREQSKTMSMTLIGSLI